MSSLFDLSGKVAVVTGARKGLGFGMAEGLAEAGADIAGVGPIAMTEIKKSVEDMGRAFLHVNTDLASHEPADAIIGETVRTMGRVDILVNNAGIIRRADMLDFTEKDWDDVMNINLKTVFFLSQAFARQVRKQKSGGKIINVASLLSFQGGIRVPSYTSSKSGLAGLTKIMANELAGFGIHGDGLHGSPYQRPGARQGADGPHPGGTLGLARRYEGRGRVPGVAGVRLCHRPRSDRRWRLAREITSPRRGQIYVFISSVPVITRMTAFMRTDMSSFPE